MAQQKFKMDDGFVAMGDCIIEGGGLDMKGNSIRGAGNVATKSYVDAKIQEGLAQIAVQANTDGGMNWSAPVNTHNIIEDYVSTRHGDQAITAKFGKSIAMSSDGHLIASLQADGVNDKVLIYKLKNGGNDVDYVATLNKPSGSFTNTAWGSSNDYRGVSMSADGKYIAVSHVGYTYQWENPDVNITSYQTVQIGAVYIFKRTSDTTWTHIQTLEGTKGSTSYNVNFYAKQGAFGSAVRMSKDGSLLLVGDPNYDASYSAQNNGQAYMYRFNLDSGQFQLVHTFSPQGVDYPPNYTNGTQLEDGMGYAGPLALDMSDDGSVVSIGAPYDDVNQTHPTSGLTRYANRGHVEIFTNGDTSTNTWAFKQTITCPAGDFTTNHYFGNNVAVSGDGRTIFAYISNSGGYAYKYYSGSPTGSSHIQSDVITISTSAVFDTDFYGSRLVVGDPQADASGTDNGQVKIFNTVNNSQLIATLNPESASGKTTMNFGSEFCMSDDNGIMVVSAPGDTVNIGIPNKGAFHIYR